MNENILRESICNKFEEWVKRPDIVSDFMLTTHPPYILEVPSTEKKTQKPTLIDYLDMFNQKSFEFFERCEKIKLGFIKNRRYRNVDLIDTPPEDPRDFQLRLNRLIHKNSFLFYKTMNKIDNKFELTSAKEFQLFISTHFSNHKLLGWLTIGKRFCLIYEYLDTNLDYYLATTSLTEGSARNLLRSIVEAFMFYSEKGFPMNSLSIYVKSDQPIFTFSSELKNEDFDTEVNYNVFKRQIEKFKIAKQSGMLDIIRLILKAVESGGSYIEIFNSYLK